jgi:dTDP-4-dehydrorhamnose reductase
VKVLILGRGFIGTRLFAHLLNQKIDVTLVDKKTGIDYTDRKIFSDYLKNSDFTIIINCSGYTGSPNVDGCEKEKEKCLFYNVSVPVQINNICGQLNIKFINVSSGCIYTGYEKEFTEKDEPNFGITDNNSSYYSFTKHMCEVLLRNTNAITLRIRMPFNSDVTSKNLIYKILKYNNIIDFKNSGTNTDDLNMFIEKLISRSDLSSIAGIFNVINPGVVTGKLISEYLAYSGLVNDNWKIVDISELDIVAQRSNCVLSDKKIKKYKLQLPSLAISLKEAVTKFAKNYKNAIQ